MVPLFPNVTASYPWTPGAKIVTAVCCPGWLWGGQRLPREAGSSGLYANESSASQPQPRRERIKALPFWSLVPASFPCCDLPLGNTDTSWEGGGGQHEVMWSPWQEAEAECIADLQGKHISQAATGARCRAQTVVGWLWRARAQKIELSANWGVIVKFYNPFKASLVNYTWSL